MKKTAIIAGSGRSGTTWVLDSLSKANQMRTLFEPLNPAGTRSAAQLAYQYVEANADEPALLKFMERVFSGKMHSLWANYRIRPDGFYPFQNSPISVYRHLRKSVGNFRTYAFQRELSGQLVKFIRANLMLPWLARNFGHPTILVVRHPCAVIASRFKLSTDDIWGAEKAIGRYRDDSMVYEMINNRFGLDLARPMSAAASFASVWCVENVLPLEWAEQGSFGVVAYENLLVNPRTEWKRVINLLGLTGVPDSESLKAPSQQSSVEMRMETFTSAHVDNWKDKLSPDTIDDVAGVLEQFGVQLYSVDRAMPAQSFEQPTI